VRHGATIADRQDFANVARSIADRILYAGLLGEVSPGVQTVRLCQIAVGIVYGAPPIGGSSRTGRPLSAGQAATRVSQHAMLIDSGLRDSVASQLFQSQWAPRYIPSLYAHLGIYAAFVVLMLCIRALLVHRNKVRDRAAAAAGVEVTHLHAFEDLTDGQNPDFRCERVFHKGIVLMIQTRCDRKKGRKRVTLDLLPSRLSAPVSLGRIRHVGVCNTAFHHTSIL
jgi:hypothetical protein